MPKVSISTPKTFSSWGLTPPAKYFLSDRVIVMKCSVHPIWTGNVPNRDDRSQQAEMNLIICYKCDQSVHLQETAIRVLQCFVPMTYQRIEWIPSCTRLRLALWCDLHIYTKGHFRLNRDLLKGLLLMTYSCNKFRYRIQNDNTFFKERNTNVLLKTIMVVHRFGISSSVWCWAKIFDLDQAAFRSGSQRSGCPYYCSFMYESFPI